MKVLVIGSGGREHAIAWRLAQSPSVRSVFVSPGNPGCQNVAQCLPTSNTTVDGLLQLAKDIQPDLTVVGPEAPLVDGVADLFEQNGFLVYGPGAAAAQLEGSKIFAKRIMEMAAVPTARFVATSDPDEALKALDAFDYPLVVKADGLAAGKGVVICHDKAEATNTIREMFAGRLVGAAGSRLVIEEFLAGEEVSFIGLSDGERILPMEPSQDHKTIFDGDKGPNTGGMGAYSDSRLLTDADRDLVMSKVMQPVIDTMRAQGTPFRGFLYAGLMMTARGPMVLEFNVRLGDPETQALLHRMNCDFGALLHAAARGEMTPGMMSFRPDPSLCVVMAAAGYPGKVRTGDSIEGIEAAETAGAVVFHAGTKLRDGKLVTSGGRVLGVTSSGPTLQQAIDNTYRACAEIRFDGMQMRTDIGRKGLKRW